MGRVAAEYAVTMSLALALALGPLSCMGTIGEPGASEGSSPTGPTTAAECARAMTTPAPTPLRRLSRAEYLATVRDLFRGVDLGELAIGTDPTDRGFENRAELLNPQPLLIEQYSTAAAEIAAAVIARPETVLPCTPASGEEAACGAQFVETFGARAFRRPLTEEEKSAYSTFLGAELAAGTPFEGAVQLTLEAMLQAPEFLYRVEVGQPGTAAAGHVTLTPYEVATRMSYLLWGSMPDDELFAKAGADELATPEQREVEARRMLADPRARDMLVEFHRQWLDFDSIADTDKDAGAYPSYGAALASAIREESDRFVASVMWSGDGTVGSLLTSTRTEVDPLLADLYGVPAPASGGWGEVTLDPAERAGLLTRASFLASRAHKLEGSPPLRGIFVMKRLLCQTPPPPPPDADLTEPAASDTAGERTNRQLFEERLSPPACASCHTTFTGLGYAFESFDAIGQYRATDHDQPVDVTGQFASGGVVLSFDGAIDLSRQLAESPDVLRCVAEQWYEYAWGRASDDSDACRVAALGDAFLGGNGDVRELLVQIVKSAELTMRPAEAP